MRKNPEELEIPINIDGLGNLYWGLSPYLWGSSFSFHFLMIKMEVHSPDSWRVLCQFKEKIYLEIGKGKRKFLLQDDEQIWEYLRCVRLTARDEQNKQRDDSVTVQKNDSR